jgi:hypothetical protein
VVVAVALATLSCSRSDDVRLNIAYTAASGAPPLLELEAIVGASKSSWPDLAAGKEVSVVLNPEGEPPELTILFKLAEEKHSWEGPRLAAKGYDFALSIGPDAQISEQHCSRPCSLR